MKGRREENGQRHRARRSAWGYVEDEKLFGTIRGGRVPEREAGERWEHRAGLQLWRPWRAWLRNCGLSRGQRGAEEGFSAEK